MGAAETVVEEGWEGGRVPLPGAGLIGPKVPVVEPRFPPSPACKAAAKQSPFLQGDALVPLVPDSLPASGSSCQVSSHSPLTESDRGSVT